MKNIPTIEQMQDLIKKEQKRSELIKKRWENIKKKNKKQEEKEAKLSESERTYNKLLRKILKDIEYSIRDYEYRDIDYRKQLSFQFYSHVNADPTLKEALDRIKKQFRDLGYQTCWQFDQIVDNGNERIHFDYLNISWDPNIRWNDFKE